MTLTATGIDGVEVYSGMRVTVERGDILVHGVSAGTPVCLYDVNGAMIYKGIAAEAGVHVIPGSGIADGTYIVKAGNATAKFAKNGK